MFIDLGILFSVRKITREPIITYTCNTIVFEFFKKDIVANGSKALDKSKNTAMVRFFDALSLAFAIVIVIVIVIFILQQHENNIYKHN